MGQKSGCLKSRFWCIKIGQKTGILNTKICLKKVKIMLDKLNLKCYTYISYVKKALSFKSFLKVLKIRPRKELKLVKKFSSIRGFLVY